MTNRRTTTIVVGIVVAIMAISTGVAVAGGGLGSATEKQAFLNDVAKRLDVTPAELKAAIEGAYAARIDAAVAAGKITKEQADAMKQRAKEGELPLLGGRGHGGFGRHHGGFGHVGKSLTATATYLGLTEAELRTQLASGKSLAEIAKAQGKSVEGLEAKLKAETKAKLDAAVKAGRLTQAQAEAILSRMTAMLGDMIEGKFGTRGHHGQGWGGPPPGGAAPSALFVPAGSPA